jgi:hypothetical protein
LRWPFAGAGAMRLVSVGADRVLVEYSLSDSFAATGVVVRSGAYIYIYTYIYMYIYIYICKQREKERERDR